MARQVPLSPSAPSFRLELEPKDWQSEDGRDLVNWYGQMMLIRRFEEKLLELEKAGLIHGPAPASMGREAGAVGGMSVRGGNDKITGTLRAHHQVLTKLVGAVLPA